MTVFEIILICILIGFFSGVALGGFALIKERKENRQRKNYREGL